MQLSVLWKLLNYLGKSGFNGFSHMLAVQMCSRLVKCNVLHLLDQELSSHSTDFQCKKKKKESLAVAVPLKDFYILVVTPSQCDPAVRMFGVMAPSEHKSSSQCKIFVTEMQFPLITGLYLAAFTFPFIPASPTQPDASTIMLCRRNCITGGSIKPLCSAASIIILPDLPARTKTNSVVHCCNVAIFLW